MSNLHLVTGYAGKEHITAADQGSFNASIMGNGQFVLERGNKFEASIIANNQVRVFGGDILMQGRHIRMEQNTYTDLYFENGTQGYKRIDLIVVRYTKDAETGIETASLEVVKGVPSASTAQVPSHTEGDILEENAVLNEMPLYEVPFDGINIQEMKCLFSTVNTWETDRQQAIEAYTNTKAQLEKEYADKIAELDEAFANIISSNADDWSMIENYGEYVADAKTVSEEFSKVNESLGGLSLLEITQTNFDALTTKDASTLYLVTE